MTKKYKATEEKFRRALLKWLNRQHQQLRANVHGDDDASLWCKEEAELVEEHIQTVEGLIFVNDALKASADEAHRQADLAYERIEELEAEVARLRLLVPRPDQTQDELVWRDHMRGVPLAALAKEFGCTKERMRYRLKKIAENKLHLTGGKDAE